MILLSLVLVCCVLCDDDGRLVDIVPELAVFWPGTEFRINPPADAEGQMYLLLDKDEAPSSVRSNPMTVFKLNRKENNMFNLSQGEDMPLMFPDSTELGVYPDAVFLYVEERDGGEVYHYSDPIVFYKSQTYYSNTTTTKLISNVGEYSPSDQSINYKPGVYVETHFNHIEEVKQTYYTIDYPGIDPCDHIVLYDGDNDSRIIALPTIYEENGGEKKFMAQGSSNNFGVQFVTTDNFKLSSYAPVVTYSTERGALEDLPFIDFSWEVSVNDDAEADLRNIKRGATVNTLVTIRYNYQYLVSYGNEIELALCAVNRSQESWMYNDSTTCADRSYALVPPYICALSKDSENEEFVHSKSTQPMATIHLDSDFDESIHTFQTSFDYNTSNTNPIPFRIVPLRPGSENPSDYIPVGPASPIYEIALDITKGAVFFVIVFVVILAICLIAYFGGKALRKHLKAKKAAQQELHESREPSQSKYDSSEREDNREYSERDKLISNKSSSESNKAAA